MKRGLKSLMGRTFKKVVAVSVLSGMLMLMFAGCGEVTATHQNKVDTEKATENILSNQPTPTDIDFSLERFNLTKRAYWVNGQREKAMEVACPVDRPIGYIAVLSDSGAIIYTSTVDGKVSSLNSYLSADSEYYEYGGSSFKNDWLADVDGSYGVNVEGVFWFTVDGNYMEWNGKYLYSDVPFHVEDPVLKTKAE